jgi:hypothetical protein
MRSVLSAGKSALEDLGEFTGLDDTFDVLNEEQQAESRMEEDVPEAVSVGSGDMSQRFSDETLNGPEEHQVEAEQDRPILVLEDNRRMRSDEAGPSRPPPKRGRLYRGG